MIAEGFQNAPMGGPNMVVQDGPYERVPLQFVQSDPQSRCLRFNRTLMRNGMSLVLRKPSQRFPALASAGLSLADAAPGKVRFLHKVDAFYVAFHRYWPARKAVHNRRLSADFGLLYTGRRGRTPEPSGPPRISLIQSQIEAG